MPARGTKYFRPLNRTGPKTGRRYGVVVSAVRMMGGEFTVGDLPVTHGPALNATLRDLVLRGELERVRVGHGGPKPKPTIYRRKA